MSGFSNGAQHDELDEHDENVAHRENSEYDEFSDSDYDEFYDEYYDSYYDEDYEEHYDKPDALGSVYTEVMLRSYGLSSSPTQKPVYGFFDKFFETSRVLAYGPVSGNATQFEWLPPLEVSSHNTDMLKGNYIASREVLRFDYGEGYVLRARAQQRRRDVAASRAPPPTPQGPYEKEQDVLSVLYSDEKTFADYAELLDELIHEAERHKAESPEEPGDPAGVIRVVMLRPVNAAALACANLVDEFRLQEKNESRISSSQLLTQVEKLRGRMRLSMLLSLSSERAIVSEAKRIYHTWSLPPQWRASREICDDLLDFFDSVLRKLQVHLAGRTNRVYRRGAALSIYTIDLFGADGNTRQVQELVRAIGDAHDIDSCTWEELKSYSLDLPRRPPHIVRIPNLRDVRFAIEDTAEYFDGLSDMAGTLFGTVEAAASPRERDILSREKAILDDISKVLLRETCAVLKELEILWKAHVMFGGSEENAIIVDRAVYSWASSGRLEDLEDAFSDAIYKINNDAVFSFVVEQQVLRFKQPTDYYTLLRETTPAFQDLANQIFHGYYQFISSTATPLVFEEQRLHGGAR